MLSGDQKTDVSGVSYNCGGKLVGVQYLKQFLD